MKIEELALPEEFRAFLTESGVQGALSPTGGRCQGGAPRGQEPGHLQPHREREDARRDARRLQEAQARDGRWSISAPLRALASEKYAEFKKLERFGMRCAIATGDFDASGEVLGKFDLLVLTNEKFDSILRHGVSWLRSVGSSSPDEVHLAGSGGQGPDTGDDTDEGDPPGPRRASCSRSRRR